MKEVGRHLMLIRFSALGDILMTVPVVDALARQYPDVRITMVSRPYVGSIFRRLPENVHFNGINPREYAAITGLTKLFCELYKLRPDAVCDLHDVLRTKFLRYAFRIKGTEVHSIHKDRKARKQFLAQDVKSQQETSFERYAKALEKTGFPVDTSMMRHTLARSNREKKGVGIAPFATYEGKTYPLERMESVVKSLSGRGLEVFLFGAGEKERAVTESWEKKYSRVKSMVGILPDMASEADLIDSLEVMVTMDSGNMHLASLTSTPVVSIWGATHPMAGFLGWGQKTENAIQIEGMECRPCSIFGNKPCRLGGYPCMNGIAPDTIVNKVLELCR